MSSSVGKTQDVGFQAGMRKTFEVPAADLWRLVTSARGQKYLGFHTGVLTADAPGVSTFKNESHYRQAVTLSDGTLAKLQVRVVAAGHGKATLALHIEKLANAKQRTELMSQFEAALQSVANAL